MESSLVAMFTEGVVWVAKLADQVSGHGRKLIQMSFVLVRTKVSWKVGVVWLGYKCSRLEGCIGCMQS